ncbi:hypothetical protein [Arthrobacter sp. ISL-69]|uniref:hypothetical protein n=1 Tax=Arthrobacter sp. ISL-69 TaxID=2819113 RepID=UPI001BE619F2|nr:hypothetical protein [Arthrobacter sp. ISL-69]MBT2537226.1 hypothetical protein [Arthrobacter sp. ISL-69]
MSELDDLRAENERLTTLNDGLARQVATAADRLEEGRRELLAIGWDACADSPTRPAKADNPYRQPVLDFTGAMICRMGDDA